MTDYAANIRAAYLATDGRESRGHDWYRSYAQRLRRAAREAGATFGQACGLIGVSSINTNPTQGINWAIATMNGATGGHLPLVVTRGAAILTAATFEAARDLACPATSDARKVRNFACNVHTYGKVCRHDVPCVTIDRWANRIATGNPKAGVPKGKAYDAVADAYRMVAAEFGLAPATLQAILWVTVAE